MVAMLRQWVQTQYPSMLGIERVLMLVEPPRVPLGPALREARQRSWRGIDQRLKGMGMYLDPLAWRGIQATEKMQQAGSPQRFSGEIPMLFAGRFWRTDGLVSSQGELRDVLAVVDHDWMPALRSELGVGVSLLRSTDERRFIETYHHGAAVRPFIQVGKAIDIWRELWIEKDADEPDSSLMPAFDILARGGREPYDDVWVWALPELIQALRRRPEWRRRVQDAWDRFNAPAAAPDATAPGQPPFA